jgi:hypothetical protein
LELGLGSEWCYGVSKEKFSFLSALGNPTQTNETIN